jgi:hypothetical protein
VDLAFDAGIVGLSKNVGLYALEGAFAVCSSRTFVVPASGGAAHAYGPVIGDMVLLSWSR